jgi:serine/threonine-protein kinase
LLKARQKLGKYRIRKRLARGGFGEVYEAYDTVEGIPVALKVPRGRYVTQQTIADFRREVKLTAKLDHPNILPIKNAVFIDGNFVIAYALGERTLAHRLKNRMSLKNKLDVAEQMLEALSYAHQQHIIHCDVKPENLILFSGSKVRLTDFGIAKVAQRTVQAFGTGSLAYISPEQAMGRPSTRSDVFSAGLIIHRMLTGELPRWPFDWPLPGHGRLKRHAPSLVAFVRRAVEVKPNKRFRDGTHMLGALRRIKPHALAYARGRRRRRNNDTDPGRDWREVRFRQFKSSFGKVLKLDTQCAECGELVDERMGACPWCGAKRTVHPGDTDFPRRCPRCKRGVKLDWRYCPWCYGGSIGPKSGREFTDKRYEARCTRAGCPRRDLMPFMRYCPWCNGKIRRRWKLGQSTEHCHVCNGGIVREFWDYCAWCGKKVQGK